MDSNDNERVTVMPSPIIITGCARSGTSMIAKTIELCGAFGGKVEQKELDQEMMENVNVFQYITKPYFLRLGIDPSCQYPLPNIYRINIPRDWKKRVCLTMYNDGYRGGSWFYKSTKASLVWPVWNYAFPDAKWIIVRRRTGDIIRSCLKTDFMKAFKQKASQDAIRVTNEVEGWKWWVHQHERRFVEMINEGMNCKIVWPDRMVHGDYQQIMETIEWLGLKWNSNVLSFIDPKFWKVRNSNHNSLREEA